MKQYFFLLTMCLFLHSNAQEIRSVKISELRKLTDSVRHPVVVNFWATWCQPCVEEIPWMMEEVSKYRPDSLQLWLVSLDFREQFPIGIQQTIQRRKFAARFFWLDETNADYFCPLVDSAWSGAIPATLLLNPRNRFRYFTESQIKPARLRELLKTMLLPGKDQEGN